MRRALLVVTLVTMTEVAAMAQTAPSIARPQDQAINDPVGGFIAEASRRFGMPTTWIRAVMQAESAGDVRAVSPKGAMGLMQIMPGTWAELRARYGLGADPFDIRDNIHAGAAYLRELHDRYGAPGFLAAYHAGPGRYDEHLATRRPLPVETKAYLAAVIPAIDSWPADDRLAAAASLGWEHAPLFAVQRARVFDGAASSPQSPSNRTSSSRAAVGVSTLVPRSEDLFALVPLRGLGP